MSWGEIDVRRNEDFCPRKLVDDPEDFVFWKYYLDIEPNLDKPEKFCITSRFQVQ